MWSYHNPVKVRFGAGAVEQVDELIAARPYALVTYNEPIFAEIADRIESKAGAPAVLINDIRPNPGFVDLTRSCAHFGAAEITPQVIIAVGGGSVMDTAKVLSAANGDFARVRRYLEAKEGEDALSSIPIIAIPTTAGTGSEVTCWGTVWHAAAGKKYSLARPHLYAEWALLDPTLTLAAPRSLTISTGLDALSHALESLWNHNTNPLSASFAVTAARDMMSALPRLAEDLENIELRTRAAQAALLAGMAFSNTKTALAHNISYPITLRYGISHGLACSFTLPQIMRSVIGTNPCCDQALAAIFGDCLLTGADRLEALLATLGVSVEHDDYGPDEQEWSEIVDLAFAGERGRNFIGHKDRFLRLN